MQDSMLQDRCCDENAVFLFVSAKATIWVSQTQKKRVKRHKRPIKTRDTRKIGRSRKLNDPDWVTSPTGVFRCSLAWNFAS
jgi:hypothetical protein